ncbi:BBP7 family outer membrane beta-barrel protein [Lacipirellula limnantheis]|uniref:BBP7 family outer membrane beta-barrel protein n=1 Tax=Lacipirellula limnantheis TaxID=2528024 RepID=A0A517U105_9BACT|nr:BBP7 family outer membrane beta-barrel protein [Lacipirellula limnantheis]QDT74309.1 hypothetical protein I41_35040 [Lacipirellula limnantheis]
MRLPLIVTVPAGRLLMLLATAVGVAEAAVGQAPPSLSDAISLTSGDVWSEQSTPAVLGTPASDPVLNQSEIAAVEPIADDGVLSLGGDAACNSCNGGGGGGLGSFYNRCGCDTPLFPYLTGPGACDNWCVGPHWNVEVDGMALRRTGVDWTPIVDLVGTAPSLLDQFNYGPGGRIFATAYNDSDYGVQVGYEGINDYNATALFPQGADLRSFDYETTFNSIELNILRRTTAPTKLFAGFRYVQVDEDFTDRFVDGKSVPPPANPPDVLAFVDTSNAFKLENRMIGFQLGALRDAWALNKWLTIEPMGNGGVYYNNFKRENLQDTTTTIVTGDDTGPPVVDGSTSVNYTQFGTSQNFSDITFIGEVGITGVFRFNQCLALRGGYQALVMDGVGEGIDAYLQPGLNGSTVLYHGARFGLEYQR